MTTISPTGGPPPDARLDRAAQCRDGVAARFVAGEDAMDKTRDQVRKLARDTGIIDWRDDDGDQHVEQMIDSLMVIWREARNQALEDAAHAFEQHNLTNRQWVNGSLWDNLTTEGCARIRALKDGD